jgi:high affinity sulfate transporter 1
MLRGTWRRLPLVASLAGYRWALLRDDVAAGVLVTAVAVPLGVGFAEVAGVPPIIGLYTSMLPLAGYALLGSSRHVKIGLDASSAAMFAAALTPLAAGAGGAGTARHLALAATLAILVGVIVLLAGVLRLGVIGDLLSHPVLAGYQTGIALSVVIGQLPKLLGFSASGDTDVRKLADVVSKLDATSIRTLAIGASALVIMRLLRWRRPAVPAALLVLVVATVASALAGFDDHGIAILGSLPSGLPDLALPHVGIGDVVDLVPAAAGIALVTSADVILTSRSFAVRLGYRVSPSQDLIGLGAGNVLSGLTGGLSTSASYARTAISERTGSRTQVSSIVAALAMALVLVALTSPLRYVPQAVLGAVVVDAVLGLVDVRAFRRLWRVSRPELVVALATVIGVLVLGLLPAIGLAVAWSMLVILRRVIRAEDAVLGRRPGRADWFAIDRYADAVAEPGLLVYRWDAPLFFGNAGVFRQRLLERLADTDRMTAETGGTAVRWLVIDGSAISELDVTAVDMLRDLADDLDSRGIALVLVEPSGAERDLIERSGLVDRLGADRLFDDLESAREAFVSRPG